MKVLLSILILMITAIYILPVKDFIYKSEYSLVIEDAEKEGVEKKDKKKDDFFVIHRTVSFYNITKHNEVAINATIPFRIHLVETPPPNCI